MKEKWQVSSSLRSIWIYIGLGLIGSWYLIGLGRQLAAENSMIGLEILILGGIVAGIIWYILHLKMDIKVGRKSLKVKTNQWWGRKAKLKWRDVVEMEPFHIPETLMWTGYSISFGKDINQFRLGDNKGVMMTMASGETYLIYSSDLYQKFDQLEHRWQKATSV